MNVALKEWAAVVLAIENGIQTVLLRKGGIAEETGDFALHHTRFLLYPTFEHQKPEHLKPEYRHLVDATRAERQGNLVTISSYAEVQKVAKLESMAEAEPFQTLHIWTHEYVNMRLDYKRDRPLWLLHLKVFKLRSPLCFVEKTAYVGCRSWVILDETSDLTGATAVTPLIQPQQ